MADRHIYDKAQLDRYYDRICLPKDKRVFDVRSLTDDEQLVFLKLLQKHELVKVPWENTVQHYSWHRTIYVKPAHLYNKIVGNEGVGGYCMEANQFFGTVLHSLGFKTYMAGSRIYNSAQKRFSGWTHVVNLVTINGLRHLIDGGFGPQGAPGPFPLLDGKEQTQIAPAQARVQYRSIDDNLDQTQRIWVYEHRNTTEHEWAPMYCFTDIEFTPADVQSMNLAPWLSRTSFFTYTVVAVRFTTDRETDEGEGPMSPNEDALLGEIDGTISLNHNTLKWLKGGKKIVEKTFETDQQRVEGLKRYFGIELSDIDRDAIKETTAEIRAPPKDG